MDQNSEGQGKTVRNTLSGSTSAGVEIEVEHRKLKILNN